MPCNTIQEVKVKFAITTDRNLLVAALNDAGLNASLVGERITFVNGSYDCRTHEFKFIGLGQKMAEAKVNEFKKLYSKQVVFAQAKRFGWQLKQTGQYEYEVIKR